MNSDAKIIDAYSLEDLATPANVRLGRELAAGDEVELTTFSSGRLEAQVGGNATERRRVELWLDADRPIWSCTCTNDADLFCKHLVAAVVHAEGSTAK